ncbi:hypothetical protein ACFVTY_09525 [Streptomyces sp. NPDC058067]|uniref:hypothetical protein n=1 Tax=Streptomyces sp. NPDC058067 TaxID=3346324 RepID=UPI0036EC4056
MEETFQAAKGLAGLDEHQVRHWTSWHRWTTLAMLAHAFLAVTAAIERSSSASSPELTPLTCAEIQRLFATLIVQPVRDLAADCDGRHDAADTRPAPAPVTTSGKPLYSREDHDLLEY